jgi:hypothetical protein
MFYVKSVTGVIVREETLDALTWRQGVDVETQDLASLPLGPWDVTVLSGHT